MEIVNWKREEKWDQVSNHIMRYMMKMRHRKLGKTDGDRRNETGFLTESRVKKTTHRNIDPQKLSQQQQKLLIIRILVRYIQKWRCGP